MLSIPISTDTFKWSTIFEMLESNLDTFNIQNYEVGQTTLAEIFLELHVKK